jgi:hypothetical protein
MPFFLVYITQPAKQPGFQGGQAGLSSMMSHGSNDYYSTSRCVCNPGFPEDDKKVVVITL